MQVKYCWLDGQWTFWTSAFTSFQGMQDYRKPPASFPYSTEVKTTGIQGGDQWAYSFQSLGMHK